MPSTDRQTLLGETRGACDSSKFLLGLIARQTPDLAPEALAILDRVEGLSTDAEHGNPRSLIKRRHSIQGQVAAIGLRSKALMLRGSP